MQRWIAFMVGCMMTAGCDEPLQTQQANDAAHFRDQKILKLVLEDLSIYDGPYRPLNLGRKVPRDIYFSLQALEPGWTPNALGPLEKEWPNISKSERRLIRQATDLVADRHRLGHVLEDFAVTNRAIHVIKTEPDDAGMNAPSGQRYPIQAWPPGYSEDRSLAVVHLYFSEVLHSSLGTYVLILENGTWKIRYRGFVTYP